MKAYLIDAENISPRQFFKNYKFEKKEYKKSIFYIVGNSHLRIDANSLKILNKTKYEIFSFDYPHKDYADKIILTLLGSLATKKKITDIYIISNDNIFENLEYMNEFFDKKIYHIRTPIEKKKDAKASKEEVPLFAQHKEEILRLLKQAKSKGEFHNFLQKKYEKSAGELYRFIKKTHPELLKQLNA